MTSLLLALAPTLILLPPSVTHNTSRTAPSHPIAVLPFVDNFAHIGGCVSGFLLGLGIIWHRDYKGGYKFRQVCVGFFSLAVVRYWGYWFAHRKGSSVLNPAILRALPPFPLACAVGLRRPLGSGFADV